MLTYLFLWIPMILIAVANGFFREFVLKKFMPELRAHQLSTILLISILAVYGWLLLKQFPLRNVSEAIWAGILWLTLTLAFEFGLGRLRGRSWRSLLADYNIARGRIWLLVPLTLAIMPFIIYRVTNCGCFN